MKRNVVKLITPFCSVLILTACMGKTESKYRAEGNITPENSIQSDFINKGGLTGKVLSDRYVKGSIVCFDENKNGFCDSSEANEKSFEQGDFSFSKEVSDLNQGTVLIAQIPAAITLADGSKGTQKIVFSANQVDPGQNQMITPFTTLVVNEQLFNPYANGKKDDAVVYLAATNLMSKEVLEGEDYIASNDATDLANATNLTNAFTQAFSIKENDPFFAIANVVDKAIKTKTLAVTIDSLGSQTRLDQNLSLVDSNKKTSWEKLYEDEVGLGGNFAKDAQQIVTYSKWHNKLTILDSSDINNSPTLLDSKKFIFVDEARDVVDTSTGASEQELTQIQVTSDGNTVYSMLTKFEDESKDIGVGVYLSDISFSTIPETIFATENNSFNFYKYEDITDIALSSDNTRFGVSGDDKKILLFNAGNLSSPTDEITTSKRVKSILFSDDSSMIFAGLSKKFKNSFAIFEVFTKGLLGEFILDDYPTTIVQKGDNEIFVASSEDNKIFHLDISDKSNIKQLALLTTSAKVKKLSLNSTGQYLIAALTTKQVNAFDLTNTSKVATIGLEDVVVNAFDVGNNTIAVIHGTNVSYFDLGESDSSNLTAAEKLVWENEHRK